MAIKKHLGFNNAADSIARKQGVSKETAEKELASSTRKASPAAKRANSHLKNVPMKKK